MRFAYRMNPHRIRLLKEAEEGPGPLVYWMSRDQRTRDNWALLFAQKKALEERQPLVVAFCLVPAFLNATARQYHFMLKGLQEVEKDLREKGIPFCLLSGLPERQLPLFVREHSVGALVTDFDPLRIKRAWKKGVAGNCQIPIYEVDAHNIVPCWKASPKQEFAARTFRPKISRLLPDFLQVFPDLERHAFHWKGKVSPIDWRIVERSLKVDDSVAEVNWIKPGEGAAQRALKKFLREGLRSYDEARNDPTVDGQSTLSPYLHFGHISAQRVALEVRESNVDGKSRDAFLEELIVRRELSDNFCFYNGDYDRFEGFPSWAQTTLKEHLRDRREYRYSLEQFESAGTHDELWNAAQMEMAKTGKMHGYMRMYWAKKILEWTESPEEALKIAMFLNDKYELDGRDPNGYVGCAWSIGGVHDRAWFKRPVFGKIRYMSYNGCRSKFDVDSYVQKSGRL
ncbi:MAG TPA: deoxyribodipyrimidine photo-lyase [Desulfatiglandales bacterium]|nr:deoxyribodipyrimidine photo-lyase [Desulfatiglandales bacterium]